MADLSRGDELSQLFAELPDDVLRDTWARAHAWLLTSVRDVLQKDGWTPEEDDLCGEVVIILKKPFDTKDIRNYAYSKMVEVRVAIPETISVLFHAEFEWKQLFNIYALDAKRLYKNSSTMYADAVHSCIADYFYLIQMLLPGLVGLVREDEIDDVGEYMTTRILPSVGWIEDHRDVLIGILGEQLRFDNLLAAATDHARAFKDECIYRYSWDSDRDEAEDFAACDQEFAVLNP
ncbi:hypothetical protein C8R44DRAFT_973614 [Mycena epipterygia]|nr:hypothetical protein C8R44DRAFT_973614 [Mycena epipterygia]